jgi:hypothetical protein
VFSRALKKPPAVPSLPLKKRETMNREAIPLSTLVSSTATSETTSDIRPKMSTKELLEIIRSQAMNDSDKFNILEARDKLIRETSKIATSGGEVRLKGICPDICPEKERYSRSIKNQLRVYEKLDVGFVNHKATVKEYSRSSADQDMPLLHDLRPSHVLKMALNHLLVNVIDRIENMQVSF